MFFFQKLSSLEVTKHPIPVRQEMSQNFRHLLMRSTWKIEPLSSGVRTVLSTVDDRALEPIKLPMLKMSSHQNSQMPSTLLLIQHLSVEHQSGPAHMLWSDGQI